ncbi:MAG: RHS repeat protein, partial [Pseudomonadota bacterium]|nr:RHS repeat protein [Pseudomonadota bacterium]
AAWVGSAHDAGVTNISSTSMQMTVPADAPVAADQLAIVTPGGTVWSGQDFTVTTSMATGGGTNGYTYDSNGRLYSISTSVGTAYYHYDAAGNVTSITSTP